MLSIGKTSNEVKNRWKSKNYKRVGLELRKELVAEWEEKLKQDGKSKNGFVREKIEEYLSEKK